MFFSPLLLCLASLIHAPISGFFPFQLCFRLSKTTTAITCLSLPLPSAGQCKILFFRHEIWRKIRAASMRQLSGSVFTRIPRAEAHAVLSDRSIGFSHVRVLPKPKGFRPILNMSRANSFKRNSPHATKALSINAALKEAFSALTFEKVTIFPTTL